MKTCPNCSLEKELSEYNRKGGGYQSLCKCCNREYQRKHYLANKGKYRADNDRRRAETGEWYKTFKSTLSCTQCGESHRACIEFHHTDNDKEDSVARIANTATSPRAILREVAKCMVLCSNCHRKLHYAERWPDYHPSRSGPDAVK